MLLTKAAVVQGKLKRLTKENYNSSSVLVFKSTEKGISSQDVMKCLMQSVNSTICVNGTRVIRDGALVYCKDEVALNKLKSALRDKLTNLEVREAKNRDLGLQLETDNRIIQNIILLNDLDKYAPSDFRIVTKLKGYASYVNIILEVLPEVHSCLIKSRYLFLGWKKCEVSDNLNIVQCSKCALFGHTSVNFKKDPVCLKCSEGHLTKNCTDNHFECYNCRIILSIKNPCVNNTELITRVVQYIKIMFLFINPEKIMGKSHNNNIKFGLLNIRSPLSDFNAFVDVLTTDKFDIFAITETWLQNDIPLDSVSVNEYNFFCNNRATRGGGVGIYTNKEFKVEIVDLNVDSRPYLEQLWVKITIRRQIFIVGSFIGL
nr:unnamed protein product [Callosobruchus analis]